MLYLARGTAGFCAVYELKDAQGNLTDESFLFWSHNGPKSIVESFRVDDADQDKSDQIADLMTRELGFDPEILPNIVKTGSRNFKVGQLSSSQPPGDWRQGLAHRGRLIFIGDSIHAMTRRSQATCPPGISPYPYLAHMVVPIAGRGQGANQAMKDAAVLFDLLTGRVAIDSESPRSLTDRGAFSLAKEFDEEMYPRAFGGLPGYHTNT